MTEHTLQSVHDVLRNILHVLQEEPGAYRRFGVYWWPIKAMLKTVYTTDHLYMLGDYVDNDQAETVSGLNLNETLTAALHEFSTNSRLGDDGRISLTDEGETVVIYDEDAGI